MYTIRYKLKDQKGNFVKYIIPKTIDPAGRVIGTGIRAEARKLWDKLAEVTSVNDKKISEAHLCYGGDIIFDDGVVGNAIVDHYQIIEKMDEFGNRKALLPDPELPKPEVKQEEPEEIIAGEM